MDRAAAEDPSSAPAPLRTRLALWSFFTLAPVAAGGGGLALVPLQALAAVFGVRYRAVLKACAAAWAPLLLLSAFLAWTATTLLWSPFEDPGQALRLAGGVAAGIAFVALAGVGAGAAGAARAAGVAFAVVTIALLAIETVSGLAINRLFNDEPNLGIVARNAAKGVSVLVVAVWAVTAAMIATHDWRKLGWKLILAASAILSLQFDQNANALGFAAGGVAFALGWAAPRLAPILVAGGVSLWLLIAPFVTPLILAQERLMQAAPMSWKMRGEIWAYALERIGERPWFGAGLDAARTMKDLGELPGLGPFQLMPLHPHSFSLHVWLETGLVGASLLAAALIAGAVWSVRRIGAHRAAAAGLCGVFAATFAIWNVSYGAWQEWFVTVPFIGAALAAACVPRDLAAPPPEPEAITFGDQAP